MTDALLKKAAGGDPEAFAELAGPFLKGLYAFIRCRVPRGAEDLYQETLMEAWRGLPGFDGRASLKTWVYGIARHKCLDQLRREYRRPVAPLMPEGEAGPGVPVEGFEDGAVRRIDLQTALRGLNGEDRGLLQLVYAEGFSVREAAQILCIPEGTVKSRLHSLRKALRQALGENKP